MMDKTGTLTVGEPRVVSVRPTEAVAGEDEVLALAAAAEWNSEHPIGRAIYNEAAVRDLTVPVPGDVAYSPGAGVSAHVEGRRITVGRCRGQESRAERDTPGCEDEAALSTESDPEARRHLGGGGAGRRTAPGHHRPDRPAAPGGGHRCARPG